MKENSMLKEVVKKADSEINQIYPIIIYESLASVVRNELPLDYGINKFILEICTFITEIRKRDAVKDFDIFVKENKEKIHRIFIERNTQIIERFPNLDRVDIIFIWFLIEHHIFALLYIWERYFPIGDLDKISVMWGKPINDIIKY